MIGTDSMEAVRTMLYPDGVAVVGSVSPGKLGAVITRRLLDAGYEAVYNVNPKAAGIDGKPGFRLVSEIPGRVDLCIFVCPAATVPDMVRDAGKKGVKSAVVISSGFSEAGHPELEQELKKAAEEAGIRYVGPNCAGILNTACGLIATLEVAPRPGRVSLLSQSGAFGGTFMDAANAAGMGMGKFLSYGNGSDLNDTDLLEYLSEDPDTDVICMYLENVKGGRHFMKTLEAAARKKPVLVIKSGRTENGARAAQSHTGALAGSDRVYGAVFDRCGAVRAETFEEMIDLAKGIAASVHAERCGRKVGILTNSGGPGVLTSDRCSDLKLEVPMPDRELKDSLSSFLPSFAGLANPIDITVEGTPEQYRQCLEKILDEYDAAVVIYVGTPYLKALPYAEAVASARQSRNKPVAAYFAVGSDIAEAKAYLGAHDVPCYPSGERAASGIAAALSRAEIRPEAAAETSAEQFVPFPYEKGHKALLEPEAMGVLESLGIRTPAHRVAQSPSEAADAAEKIGFPVCMKIVSRDILHKSDVGGVKLNILTREQAKQTFLDLKGICAGKDFSGVIVYPMLKNGLAAEVIVGMIRDATFGPVCMFGLGGIFTEILKDVGMAPAPLTKADADRLIRSIRSLPVLTGARGGPACDLDSLAEVIVKLSVLMDRYPEIREVDLNPVACYSDSVLPVDARMILGD